MNPKIFRIFCALTLLLFRVHPEQRLSAEDTKGLYLETLQNLGVAHDSEAATMALGKLYDVGVLFVEEPRLRKSEKLLVALGMIFPDFSNLCTSDFKDEQLLYQFERYLKEMRQNFEKALEGVIRDSKRADRIYPYRSNKFPSIAK